jgi:hypothetical protein
LPALVPGAHGRWRGRRIDLHPSLQGRDAPERCERGKGPCDEAQRERSGTLPHRKMIHHRNDPEQVSG